MKYKNVEIRFDDHYIYVSTAFGTYRLKVRNSSNYTFKVNKASVSAMGGTEGLCTFLRNCIEKKVFLVLIDRLLQEIIKKGEEYA